jgi:hypothetical protein
MSNRKRSHNSRTVSAEIPMNITVRLPGPEREALERGRMIEERSLSQYIRLLLVAGLKEEGLIDKNYKIVS